MIEDFDTTLHIPCAFCTEFLAAKTINGVYSCYDCALKNLERFYKTREEFIVSKTEEMRSFYETALSELGKEKDEAYNRLVAGYEEALKPLIEKNTKLKESKAKGKKE